MRPVCLALLLVLFSPALASAQIRFTHAAADLGELRGGPVYQHRFDFVNQSSRPIEVIDFRLGCGCLQPLLAKRIYQPGEKGTLLMNVRTLGQPNGARSWHAHIVYRDGETKQEASLVIAARIRNEVTIEPSILAITVDSMLRQEVTIKDHRAQPMQIKAVLASSPALRISTLPTSAGVTKIILEVSRSGLTASRQEETLDIYSDDPHYRHLQVPITLTKAHRVDVSATPKQVELTGSGSQLIRLRGAGDQTVRIERAEADHAAVKCTWAAGPGTDATLKVSINGAQVTMPGPMGSVRVHLREPAGAILTIPVTFRKE